MNLLDLVIKITCDDQASGEVGKIGDGIKNTLSAAAKVGGAAVAALGTATVAIGKKALDSYANYQQLVGGIETLFGAGGKTLEEYAASVGKTTDQAAAEYDKLIAAQNKMMGYAEQAYKTAGTSANKYMEITTSFAASLISSLGGDTAKAADMANMAVVDMSDNANKMGTSLETVQEAYQSLARGNYEMLDSLKLGYGGTKEELERLLSDAEKFSAAQGNVRDFSVDSYSDIVEAIHIVQDEMGITGTTAEEAEKTISGSINMMKASWDNWLAGLGNEDADMEGLTDQLVESVVIAGENIVPRVGQIMTTLGQTIADYAPSVGLYLRDALINVLPEAVQGPMRDAFAGIDEIIGTFGQAVNDLVLPAIEQLSPAFQYLFEAIQNAQPLLEFLANTFGVVLASAISIAVQAFGALVTAAGVVINGLQQLYDFIAGFVQGVVAFFTVDLPNGINTLIQWFARLPGNIAAFLASVISNVASWVSQMASNAANAGSQFVSNVVNFIMSLPGNVASFLGQVISRVGSWVGEMASGAARAASQFASSLINGLASIPGRVASIGASIIQGMVNGVIGAAGRLIDAVTGAVGNAIEGAKNLLGIHSPSRVFREIGQYTMQGAALGVDDDADLLMQSTDTAMRGMVDTAQSVTGNTSSASASQSDIIEWLADNLPAIISQYTPVIGQKEFGRMARKAVTYA